MSTGRSVVDEDVEIEVVKSEERRRKRAVWVMADSGVVERRWVDRDWVSQVGETGRCLVVRRWVVMCCWGSWDMVAVGKGCVRDS